MKPYLRALAVLVALCLLGAPQALAQAEADPVADRAVPGLSEVINKAPARSPDVRDAVNALDAEERNVSVLQLDPQTLPVDLSAAARDVAAAREALELARARARLGAATAYTGYIEALGAVEQAKLQHQIRAVAVQGTRARFDAGAATELDVLEAGNALADAEATLHERDADLAFARADLANWLGYDAGAVLPVEAADVPAVASEEDLLAAATERSGRLLSSARAIEAAREQLAVVDNEFSARNQITAAQEAVENAVSAYAATHDAVELALRQAVSALTAAQNRYQSAVTNGEVAAANLTAQQARFAAGSISRLALMESELSWLASEATIAGALHALLLNRLQLEVTLLQ